jgi:hypothetical protein
MMGLVDDKKDGEVPVVDEARDLLLDGTEAEGTGPVGLEAELQGKLAEEVGGVDGGVVEVDGADLLGVEGVAKAAQGGGLAGAGLAGEEADAAGVDEVGEARVELVEGGQAEELLGGEVTVEGRMGEAEDVGVHQRSPCVSSPK